jgi:hypothetical protein
VMRHHVERHVLTATTLNQRETPCTLITGLTVSLMA